MGSQNNLDFQRSLKLLSPTVSPPLPGLQLNHVPKCYLYASFEHLQGR